MMADVCVSLRSMSAFISRNSSSSEASRTSFCISSWRSCSSDWLAATCSFSARIWFSALSSLALSAMSSSEDLLFMAALSSAMAFSSLCTLFSSSCFSDPISFIDFSWVLSRSTTSLSSCCCCSILRCRSEILDDWSATALACASLISSACPPCDSCSISLAISTSFSTNFVFVSASSFARLSCTPWASALACCSDCSLSAVSARCSSSRRKSVCNTPFSVLISAMRMLASSSTLVISATRFSYMCEKDMVPGAASDPPAEDMDFWNPGGAPPGAGGPEPIAGAPAPMEGSEATALALE
mmetsp:Transcript_21170/g.29356  ORF Transcript_21170/g.29356 Transcript_21170/m.29356 type:complete len:299 (+) Transcript_21170:1532-2428(+)